MHFLRGYADSPSIPTSHLVVDTADDVHSRLESRARGPRLRIEADPLLIRVATPVPSAAAFKGLRRQATLGAPAKLVWSAGGGFQMVAEVPRQEHSGDVEDEARAALDDGLAWLAQDAPANGPSTPSLSLIEVLKGAGCFVRPASAGTCFVDVHLGGSVCRALVGERPDGRVQVSLPATTVRVESRRASQAAAVFALEANHRLRLARVSVALPALDRVRVVWDVVINGGPCLSRRLPDALEALFVAREETARALRMLRSHEVADAYLGSAVWRRGGREDSETE